jgi:hypothetical protein
VNKCKELQSEVLIRINYLLLPKRTTDGTYIENVGTGPSDDVAMKYLARKNSLIIGFVGAGEKK